MAVWPATLPPPRISGYDGEQGPVSKRTDFDMGPARQRRMFTSAPEMLNVSFRFKPAEMAIFKEFWKDDIGFGVDWFSIELNLGSGLATYDARFKRACKYAALPGMNWDVQGMLEVRDSA